MKFNVFKDELFNRGDFDDELFILIFFYIERGFVIEENVVFVESD